MVLWEITVATAYFLGLKRTYKLALKLQRRVITPRHPKLRRFLHRRTRAAFDIALSVHRKIQEGDIGVGRNLGNWILRWFNHVKPSAGIQCPPRRPLANNLLKHVRTYSQASISLRGPNLKFMDRNFSHHLFATSWNIRPKSFPTLSMMMMMQPTRPTGMAVSTGIYATSHLPDFRVYVFRKDIMQWMHGIN